MHADRSLAQTLQDIARNVETIENSKEARLLQTIYGLQITLIHIRDEVNEALGRSDFLYSHVIAPHASIRECGESLSLNLNLRRIERLTIDALGGKYRDLPDPE